MPSKNLSRVVVVSYTVFICPTVPTTAPLCAVLCSCLCVCVGGDIYNIVLKLSIKRRWERVSQLHKPNKNPNIETETHLYTFIRQIRFDI